MTQIPAVARVNTHRGRVVTALCAMAVCAAIVVAPGCSHPYTGPVWTPTTKYISAEPTWYTPNPSPTGWMAPPSDPVLY